jgi:hypothetical protein
MSSCLRVRSGEEDSSLGGGEGEGVSGSSVRSMIFGRGGTELAVLRERSGWR